MQTSHGNALPHVVLIPSAGMGHLVPFSRLAVALTSACEVSVATVLPTVSSAESAHLEALFSAYPAIRRLVFHLATLDASEFDGADPFFLRFEALRSSAPSLGKLLAGAGAGAGALAVVTDIALTSVVIPVAEELRLPCYVFFTSSAAMLSMCVHFPAYLDANAGNGIGDVDLPCVYRIPKASVPQGLHDPNHIFTRLFVADGRKLARSHGLLVNSLHAFEPEAIAAFRDVVGFPPVFSVGPLAPVSFTPREPAAKHHTDYMRWLEAQPLRSVVYVCFGSRNTIPREQLTELAKGLEASGHRFMWVVRSTVVDKDDHADLGELLGKDFLERVQGRGMVVKGWVQQEEVLKQGSVGLFISHCGWNSVTEAAASGVPVLAWPRFGDQRVNANVVARTGLGVWDERWCWEGEEGLVRGEEIAGKVKALMSDEAVRKKASGVRDAAAKALAVDGWSYRNLAEFVRLCLDGRVPE